jgi:hypothetical protein
MLNVLLGIGIGGLLMYMFKPVIKVLIDNLRKSAKD